MSARVSMPTLSSVVNCEMEPHGLPGRRSPVLSPALLLMLDTQHSKGVSTEGNLGQEHVHHRRSRTEDTSRDDLELQILLPLLPNCWDRKSASPCLVLLQVIISYLTTALTWFPTTGHCPWTP